MTYNPPQENLSLSLMAKISKTYSQIPTQHKIEEDIPRHLTLIIIKKYDPSISSLGCQGYDLVWLGIRASLLLSCWFNINNTSTKQKERERDRRAGGILSKWHVVWRESFCGLRHNWDWDTHNALKFWCRHSVKAYLLPTKVRRGH